MTDKPKKGDLLFVYDVETTGVNKTTDRIVEIAWLIMNWQGKIMEHEKKLLNPEMPIPRETTEIHGIRNSDVLGEPTFKDYAPRLVQVLTDYDPWICGFANDNFDDQILDAEFARVGMNIGIREWPGIDGRKLFVKLRPRTLEACGKTYLGKEKIEQLQQRYTKGGDEVEKKKGLKSGWHSSQFDTVVTAYSILAMLEAHKDELPQDKFALLEWLNKSDPNFIDLDGKFKFDENGRAVFNFGKYRGASLAGMVESEPGYLEWMLEQDFPRDTQQVIREALAGRFPKKE